MRALSNKITLAVIASIVLIIFLAAVQGYRASVAQANLIYDQELSLLSDILISTVSIDEPVPLRYSPAYQSPDFLFQVAKDDRLLYSSTPLINSTMSDLKPGFSTRILANKRWRILSIQSNDNRALWYIVGQQINNRQSISESMIFSAMQPIIIALPILALCVYLIIRHELSPLKKVARQLTEREANNLAPIEVEHDSIEMAAVITKVNHLFEELNAAFARERDFVSHAAHELRTPLSIMRVKIHNLRKAIPEQSAQLLNLKQDADRMIQVVNQLLLLSQTSPQMISGKFKPCPLFSIAQDVIAGLYVEVDKKHQTIELIGDEQLVNSQSFLLHTLLNNLIGNAIKYTPDYGHISVVIEKHKERVELIIADSGVGISDAYKAKVFERFFRTPNSASSQIQGAGLGLTIVAQIVAMHKAKIKLDTSQYGGLTVLVSFEDIPK